MYVTTGNTFSKEKVHPEVLKAVSGLYSMVYFVAWEIYTVFVLPVWFRMPPN